MTRGAASFALAAAPAFAQSSKGMAKKPLVIAHRGASGERHEAAISVGSNPTFQGSRRTVEAYLLDFDGDLYGEHVGVEFASRLRPMAAFAGVEKLVEAMANDVAETRRQLGAPPSS